MFTVPRPNVVSSDEGFSIEVLGRTGLRYQDESCTAMVDGEVLAGAAGFMIYRDSIKIIDPPNGVEVGVTRRDTIVENIRRAFSFRGFDIEIF